MPRRLHRYYGSGYLHFITSSCYQRRPLLNTPRRRTWFLEILEQVRRRYTFVVVGYVVMPEHFHLLISEPERGNPSTVMQVLKQRFARKVLRDWRKRSERGQNRLWEDALNEGHVWQRRFYDFMVWSDLQSSLRLSCQSLSASQLGIRWTNRASCSEHLAVSLKHDESSILI